MAKEPTRGSTEDWKPKAKDPKRLIPSPVSMLASAPHLFPLFQYSPQRYGAMKLPATAPQEMDMRFTIKETRYRARIRERATKNPQSTRMESSDLRRLLAGMRSMTMAEEETRTREERVDMEAEKTRRRKIKAKEEGMTVAMR